MKERFSTWVERHQDQLVTMSDTIWEFAEVGLREHRSADLLASVLEGAGFAVERGVAGLPTAFVATYGNRGPVIGLLGEYDALPGLAQDRVPYRSPKNGRAGHGCGHNLLGVAAAAAAMAVAEAIQDGSLAGTVRFFGCPAEETLVGKVFMARAGLFDGLDAALTWHPGSSNTVWASSTAMNSARFTFYGRTAHAAANPDRGRSALDGVELMNIGVNYLREHVIPEARIHYVITHGGGEPNVVPARAQVWYYVRAPRRDQVDEIFQRVLDVSRGAAIMTGTTFDVEILTACYNVLPNHSLGALLMANLESNGGPAFTREDVEFASRLVESFEPGQLEAAARSQKLPETLASQVLNTATVPPQDPNWVMAGSTDVGDVSWIVPTAQLVTACCPVGTAGHSWQFTAASGSGMGHRGMLLAARVLAGTVAELLASPGHLAEARAEFGRATKDTPYRCALPAGALPPLDQLGEH
ncbi:MAG: amidohydrolase [Bacillota bacterium]